MSPSTKCGVLLLTALGGWALSEFDLVSRAPQETTAAALRQFQGSDADAVQLRGADAAKNGWLVFWPLLLVIVAGLLFWDDAMKMFSHASPKADNASLGGPQ
jgi:hypothetical protein